MSVRRGVAGHKVTFEGRLALAALREEDAAVSSGPCPPQGADVRLEDPIEVHDEE
jgi:hypothetical protein